MTTRTRAYCEYRRMNSLSSVLFSFCSLLTFSTIRSLPSISSYHLKLNVLIFGRVYLCSSLLWLWSWVVSAEKMCWSSETSLKRRRSISSCTYLWTPWWCVYYDASKGSSSSYDQTRSVYLHPMNSVCSGKMSSLMPAFL